MPTPRDSLGRIVSRACPDPNCDGRMVIESESFGRRTWRCDGLTHVGEIGSLFACETQHTDGDPVAA